MHCKFHYSKPLNMKNIFYVLPMLLSLHSTCFGQEITEIDSMEISFEEQIAYTFEHVDLSEVLLGNGILYEHGYPFFNIDLFNGALTDTNYSSMPIFGMAYATLYGMALDVPHRLLEPEYYRSRCDTIKPSESTIPLVVMHQYYTRISPTAIEDGLMTVAGNQIFDVPGRPFSPYLQKEVFMICPARTNIHGGHLQLRFDDSLFFSNTGKSVESLAIDVGDGLGYVPVEFGQVVSAMFEESGQKYLKFKVSYTDSTIYFSHSEIYIDLSNHNKTSIDFPYDTPDIVHHISVSATFDISSSPESPATITASGGGTIRVALACGHTSIQKPFIWAEGWNPVVNSINLNLTYQTASDRINYQNATMPKTLSEYLEDEGYDFIALDFDDGGGYLQVNAKFIEEAINWVNVKFHKVVELNNLALI